MFLAVLKYAGGIGAAAVCAAAAILKSGCPDGNFLK